MGTMSISFHLRHTLGTTLKPLSHHYAFKGSLQKQLALTSMGLCPVWKILVVGQHALLLERLPQTYLGISAYRSPMRSRLDLCLSLWRILTAGAIKLSSFHWDNSLQPDGQLLLSSLDHTGTRHLTPFARPKLLSWHCSLAPPGKGQEGRGRGHEELRSVTKSLLHLVGEMAKITISKDIGKLSGTFLYTLSPRCTN